MKRILSGANVIHGKDSVGCYVMLMRAEEQRTAGKYIKQRKSDETYDSFSISEQVGIS